MSFQNPNPFEQEDLYEPLVTKNPSQELLTNIFLEKQNSGTARKSINYFRVMFLVRKFVFKLKQNVWKKRISKFQTFHYNVINDCSYFPSAIQKITVYDEDELTNKV